MANYSIDVNSLINAVKSMWNYSIDESLSNREVLVLRFPFTSEEEIENFRTDLMKATKTGWVVYYNNSKRAKYAANHYYPLFYFVQTLHCCNILIEGILSCRIPKIYNINNAYFLHTNPTIFN